MSSKERLLGQSRSHIRLILATRDTEYAGELTEFLSESPYGISIATVLEDVGRVPEALQQYPDSVVLIDDDLSPTIPSILPALRAAGASRVLLLVSSPASQKQLPAGVEPIFKFTLGSLLAERIRSLPVVHRSTLAAETAAQELTSPTSTTQPGIFAFFSPRGGAGTSTIAANLAYLYAAKGKRVALVDFARFGAQHIMLRQAQRTQGLSGLITLLSQEPGQAGGERLNAYLQQALQGVELSKVQFQLLPAALPARMEQVTADHARRILAQLCQGGFQIILVDLGSEISDRMTGVLTMATRLAVPILPEIVSAWHALHVREQLNTMLGNRTRSSFLINRLRADAGFDPNEFVSLGGSPYLGTLPDEYQHVKLDLALGRLTAMRTNAPFTKALRRVAHSLYPVFSEWELRQRRWPWTR